MSWKGRHLLYRSADGQVAVVDGDGGNRRDLSRLAGALLRRGEADKPTASWASDLRQSVGAGLWAPRRR